jgi:hypothetical protein
MGEEIDNDFYTGSLGTAEDRTRLANPQLS